MIKLIKLEFKKIQKTPIWLVLLVFILIFFYSCYDLYYDFQNQFWRDVSVSQDMNPWHFFINSQARKIEFCIGINILILTAWLHQQEIVNEMWHRLFLFPKSMFNIVLSKILLTISLVFLQLILVFAFTVFIFKPKLSVYYSFLFYGKYLDTPFFYGQWFLFYLPAIIKVAFFQEWLTLKFRNSYLTSFFIGILGLFLSFIDYSPYSMYCTIHTYFLKEITVSIIYIVLFTYFIYKELQNAEI